MRIPNPVALGALAVATACASTATTDAASTPAVSAASVEAAGTVARFNLSGNLQPTRTRPSTVTSGSERNRVFGTVQLSATADDPRRTRAQVVVNMPARSPVQANWAIVPGRCGANALPVSGYEVYPLIEVNNTGRGQVDVMIPVSLPVDGAYHVNIYIGGIELDDVVSCANLRRVS